tara:strand:- start:1471 stop:2019 length:549 start_codon:yes stop_codon:yes gene_type:complete
MSSKKLLILDRDGTLNKDHNGYSHDMRSCSLFDDVYKLFEMIDTIINICVVTNQSGIGRGFYKESQMHEFNAQINKLIKLKTKHNGIKKFFFCPHKPSENCECRKPKNKLVIEALNFFNCEAKNAILIGDKISDCIAGISAGVDSFLLQRDDQIVDYSKDLKPIKTIKSLDSNLLHPFLSKD